MCTDSKLSDLTIDMSTYSGKHIELNSEKIIQYIKELYRERFFYYHDEIVNIINVQREYL